MHTRNYDNDVSIDAVEDPIWEPVDERPSGIPMNDRVHGRMSSNAVAGGLNGRQQLIAPTPDVGARTTEKPHRCPPQRQDGLRWASQAAATDPVKHFFPRNAGRAFTIKLIEPSIQLLALRVRQWDHLRGCRETLPKLLQKAQPFLGTEAANIYSPHGTSIPRSPSSPEARSP